MVVHKARLHSIDVYLIFFMIDTISFRVIVIDVLKIAQVDFPL